ncbi:hypothetical protein [Paenibacillus sp. 7516]|nr:hypothetical protein [Paenibacillus sp. 7516]
MDKLWNTYQLTMSVLEEMVINPLVLDHGHELEQYGIVTNEV